MEAQTDPSRSPRRVLVVWGGKLGGTEGIADLIAEALRREGYAAGAASARDVRGVSEFGAVIVCGALYGNRWHRDAQRFVARNIAALRRVPVWFVSSGPLDDSADRTVIPPTKQVDVLMERVGAQGHVTFGGRMRADARGFPASAIAKTRSGDWRNPERVRAFAADLARVLPAARPRPASDPPARSWRRLATYGIAGWALSTCLRAGLVQVASASVAAVLHAIMMPLLFTALAVAYFHARGAREPLPTALGWTLLVAMLDLTVAAGVLRSFAMFTSFVGSWLPLGLSFLTTWLTGALMSTLPWPGASRPRAVTSNSLGA